MSVFKKFAFVLKSLRRDYGFIFMSSFCSFIDITLQTSYDIVCKKYYVIYGWIFIIIIIVGTNLI